MQNKEKKCRVLLVGSDLSVKGGIVSVLKNYLAYDKWENVKLYYVPTHVDKKGAQKAIYFIKSLRKVRAYLNTGKISVAHIHVSERGSFFRKIIVSNMCLKKGVPVILHHHGAEFNEFYDHSNFIVKKLICNTLKKVNLNIVLSNQLISMIKDKCPEANVAALPNAVPVEDGNHYNPDATNLLLLGELNERKGVYVLLDAISHMDSELAPDVKLYLCGNGDLDRLKERIKELSLEHRIAHIGWIDKEEKAAIFANTKINVLPSYNEGLPMTILETMGYGIPNVSTAIASIPDVIKNGKTGFLVQPGSATELEEALWKLLNNDELRLEISKNSHELIVNNYSLDVYIKRLKKIYYSFVK